MTESSRYECEGCGESFDTLSSKRLHECPSGVMYGGGEIDAEYPVADMDLDDMTELAVEQVLICDVCGEKNSGANDVTSDYNQNGVSLAVHFECSYCGAWNDNSVTFEP